MLETEPQIISAYVKTGQVRIVYRHLLQLGEGSLRAGEASECAAEQGQFWQMHTLLYAAQYKPDSLTQPAQALGLDLPRYSACMESRRTQAAVESDNAAAVQEHIIGRPYFDINGTPLVGAQQFSRFRTVIESKLK